MISAKDISESNICLFCKKTFKYFAKVSFCSKKCKFDNLFSKYSNGTLEDEEKQEYSYYLNEFEEKKKQSENPVPQDEFIMGKFYCKTCLLPEQYELESLSQNHSQCQKCISAISVKRKVNI